MEGETRLPAPLPVALPRSEVWPSGRPWQLWPRPLPWGVGGGLLGRGRALRRVWRDLPGVGPGPGCAASTWSSSGTGTSCRRTRGDGFVGRWRRAACACLWPSHPVPPTPVHGDGDCGARLAPYGFDLSGPKTALGNAAAWACIALVAAQHLRALPCRWSSRQAATCASCPRGLCSWRLVAGGPGPHVSLARDGAQVPKRRRCGCANRRALGGLRGCCRCGEARIHLEGR